MPNPRINNQIAAPELRVIGKEGENLGVMSREDALRLVEPGIDLIEIAAAAKPPVVRLMSFDKFRYEEEKKLKKERQAQKSQGVKRVQISARAAEHDMLIKVKQLEKFLEEGHQVEIFVRLKGRERYNQPWARQKLDQFLQKISIPYTLLGSPKFAQGLSVQLIKKI